MQKEKFFTKENIETKAKSIKQTIYSEFKHPKFKLSPNKSALLIIDMQDFFCCQNSHAHIPSINAVIQNILKLENYYKKNNLPVLYTKHINTKENANLMGLWWKDILTQDSSNSQIIKALNPSNKEIIEKSQYDCFYKTELENILLNNKTEQLIITGVMTHLCCETTARAAFTRGFKSFFTIDGTATYNEKFHVNSLYNLAHGISVPVLTSDILEV